MKNKIIMFVIIALGMLVVGVMLCKNYFNPVSNVIFIEEVDRHAFSDFEGNVGGYNIKGLKDGEYTICISAKEFEYGNISKKYELIRRDVAIKNLSNATISLHQEDEAVEIDIDGVSMMRELDFFGNNYMGIATSYLTNVKEIELDKEIAICSYSTQIGHDELISIDLDNEIELGTNRNDMIVYMKITKNK